MRHKQITGTIFSRYFMPGMVSWSPEMFTFWNRTTFYRPAASRHHDNTGDIIISVDLIFDYYYDQRLKCKFEALEPCKVKKVK